MKPFLFLVHSQIGIMIGRTSQIYRRFAVIEGYSPLEVKLYRVYRTKRSGLLENTLRRRYNHKKIRTRWYAFDSADLEEIDRYLRDHKAIRILDNSRKIPVRSPEEESGESLQNERDLNEEIDRLENAVQRLWKALYGK